jgi:hypothetical protein
MKKIYALALAALLVGCTATVSLAEERASSDYQVAISATGTNRLDFDRLKDQLLERYSIRIEQMQQAESDYVSIFAGKSGRAVDSGELPAGYAPWWQTEVNGPVNDNVTGIDTDVTSLFYRALNYSSQIKVFSDLPLIRETTIQEAEGPFDFTVFAEGRISDLDEPVGDDLTTGGPLRYKEQSKNVEFGVRKKFITGTDVQLSQNIGDMDTNSIYFNPVEQARTGTALTIRQPLLKAFGVDYNQTQINLAGLDTQVAQDELRRQVESHLLEISRAYWALYMERSLLVQKSRLADKTRGILDKMEQRASLDVPSSLLARTRSQVYAHELAATQAEYAVLNAQSRIRALVNDPELLSSRSLELITRQLPTTRAHDIDYATVLQTALSNRPEIAQSLRHLQSAALRLDHSANELRPNLDLFFQMYVKGLEGDYEYGRAYEDQFSEGRPSYIGGLRLEFPLGNNSAKARNLRKKIEIRQLLRQLDTTAENVLLEAEISYRELIKNYRLMVQSQQILQADQEEVKELMARIDALLIQGEPYGDMLYRLMDANERLSESEQLYAKNELTYNYASYNLYRAMGILVSSNDITFTRQKDQDALPEMNFLHGNSTGSQR